MYTVPTETMESDGTLEWDSTTIVVVVARSDRAHGLGYTYGHRAVARVIDDTLAPIARGAPVDGTDAVWRRMVDAARNIGRPGLVAHAISAVDNALWDLHARERGVPLVDLFGRAHTSCPAYGSGGFTSYDDRRLSAQLEGWARAGCRFVKMKIGRSQTDDRHRVKVARAAIGDDVELFVDANGAYRVDEAIATASWLADHDVRWLEEPVSSDDLRGLARVRAATPTMAVTAGEYGYDPWYFATMIAAGAVDVVQVDATRCLGFSGARRVATLAAAHHLPLSTHTAPALHVSFACSVPEVRHVEYFHDHVRLEAMLFEGAPTLVGGLLTPDRERIGNGLELRSTAAEPYRVV